MPATFLITDTYFKNLIKNAKNLKNKTNLYKFIRL